MRKFDEVSKLWPSVPDSDSIPHTDPRGCFTVGNDISSSGSKVLSAFTEGPLTDARLAQPERNRATNVRRLRLLEANVCGARAHTGHTVTNPPLGMISLSLSLSDLR
jgi:hypothetical protein